MNQFAQKARLAVLSAVALGSTAAMAAPIDVADVVTDIAAQIAPIVLIGGAVLLVVVSVKAFRWVRSALS